MTNMKAMVAAVLSAAFGSALAANTWYVDDDWLGKGGDGSEAKPYGVIQQAVNSATAGDTILVLPGIYDQTTATNNGVIVLIPNDANHENLTIRSAGGRDVTFIVGGPASGDEPHGPGVLGGVYCKRTSSGTTIVDGFTFRNCYGNTGSSKRGSVGLGYYSARGALHFYNCRVIACAGAPFYGATVHSTIIEGTFFADDCDSAYCSTFTQVNADNCLITRMPGRAIAHNSKIVNCTLVNNVSYVSTGETTGIESFNNSIISLASDCEVTYYPCTNTVSSSKINANKSSNCHKNVPATEIFAGLNGFTDYRPRSDSVAVGLADGAALSSQVPLVSADRDPENDPGRYSTYHDVYGTPIDISKPFNAGAIQETVAVDDPAVGLTDFKSPYGEPLVIDGETYIGAEAFIRTSSACPTQWCVTASSPATNPLSAVEDDFANLSRLSGSNGTIWVTSAPLGFTRNLSVQTAQKVFYLDPDGNDAWDGLSATHEEGTSTGPWQTFTNAAVRLEALNTDVRVMVRCAPGIYDKGDSCHARVPFSTSASARRYHFVGVAGAGMTSIVGADATTPDEHGCGADAVGCVYNKGVRSLGFTGFTFAGGRTDAGNSSDYAAFVNNVNTSAENERVQTVLCESVVTDNESTQNYIERGEHARPIVLERCRVFGNLGYKRSCFFSAILLGSLSYDNFTAGSSCIYRYTSVAVNSVFHHRNGAACWEFYKDTENHLLNSIFSDYPKYGLYSTNVVGCVFDQSVLADGANPAQNTVVDMAMFADKGGHDYRVLACSPAVGAARMDAPYEAGVLSSNYVKYAATDFEGNPVCRGVVPTVSGAFTVPLTTGVAVTDPNGLLLADGQPAAGGHYLPAGSSPLVLSANAAAKSRPVAGVTLNGETNLFARASGTVIITAEDVAAGLVMVEPVLGGTWYVNAGDDPGWATGSDANCGWGTWAPVGTVQAAVDKATDGDVIVLAPGVYADGGMTVGTQKARVLIRDKSVTIRSEQGAAKTVISGAASDDPDEYGCGAYATRCIQIENEAAKLTRIEGLTLCGGRTATSTGYDITASGSAVRGYSTALSETCPTVVDCVITNCRAYCSAVMFARIERCRFVDCTSIVRGVLRACWVFDSLFSYVQAKNDTADFDQCAAWNVSWLTNNSRPFSSSNCPFVNSLVWGSIQVSATNCIATGGLPDANKDSRIISRDQWYLDAEGRPIVGQSPLVDAGCGQRPLDDKDASGRLRVANGVIDIGALEGDWRPRYAKDIGNGVTVTEATSGIVETDRRTVSFGTGGTVSFDWACTAGQEYQLLLGVTGNGKLTVMREGAEAVVYETGEQIYAFKLAETGIQRFTLTYVPGENDPGSAEIVRAKRLIGMVLIVR